MEEFRFVHGTGTCSVKVFGFVQISILQSVFCSVQFEVQCYIFCFDRMLALFVTRFVCALFLFLSPM